MKAAVLVARRTFPDVIDRLRVHFEVEENPGDALWSEDELVHRLKGKVGMISSGGVRVTAQLLTRCPELKAVCHVGAGYNDIDVDACSAHGVLVAHTPDVLTETTADFGFALMLAAARRIGEAERYVRAGLWRRKEGIDFFAGQEVYGTTLAILGMGRIGLAIARRGVHGFRMRVLYHNRRPAAPAVEAQVAAQYVDKQTLLQQADHLIICLPYTSASRHALGKPELDQMKPTATLTNIGRGGVVDDAALVCALHSGVIASAALDVYENEPRLHPGLMSLQNVVMTPHVASSTLATRKAMSNLAADNLIAALGCGALAGRPPTPVNRALAHPL